MLLAFYFEGSASPRGNCLILLLPCFLHLAPRDSFVFFRALSRAVVRACLHGGGGSQVVEVIRLGGVTRLSI